jgi:hypothetical protein
MHAYNKMMILLEAAARLSVSRDVYKTYELKYYELKSFKNV